MEPTNEVILSLDRKQFLESLGDAFKDELADVVEEIDFDTLVEEVSLDVLQGDTDDNYNDEHDPNY